MDGTQTSEPTEAGPGSTPGQASAFRRALDDQTAREGPLDLTVPLNIAEVRAALSTSGSHGIARSAPPAAPAEAPQSASADDARPHEARRGSRHAGPRRLGRIAAFVAVAAAMSVGTACALVLSNNAQTTPVSLPASGAIPVPGTSDPQPGTVTVHSGSTSAKAAPSLSRSTAADPVYISSADDPATPPAVSVSPASSPTPSASASASATADPSGTGPMSTQPPTGAPTTSYGANWELLYQGVGDSSQEEQETTDVQSLLDSIGYLSPWKHRTYVDVFISIDAVGPDPHGFYGSATSDALAQFQVDYGVPYTDQLGSCDLATYQALQQIAG